MTMTFLRLIFVVVYVTMVMSVVAAAQQTTLPAGEGIARDGIQLT